jgi:hypothetical protein
MPFRQTVEFAMDALAASLARSPELFPHLFDPLAGTVTMLRLTRADYERASFLDRRFANPALPSRILPWAQLVRAVDEAGLRESCHFIFHIGHVGSTLLSRLLGRHPALFSLREPEILRTLAQMPQAETELAVFLKLWSRTFEPGARALVKATSFVSDLATGILARGYRPRALVMGVGPESYLATIFGAANSPMEAKALAPLRLARFHRRLSSIWRLEELGEGERVAMGWACEALALADAVQNAPQQVQILDFDRFLLEPQNALARAFAHFDVAIDDHRLAAILAGPDMRTYSKAPEFAYDAALRRAVLDEGRSLNAPEIRRGLLWLDHAARDFPQIRGALELFRANSP